MNYGRLGMGLLAITHWLCDFFWLWFLSALIYRGGRFFGQRFQRLVFAVCGAFLLVLSVRFGAEGIRALIQDLG